MSTSTKKPRRTKRKIRHTKGLDRRKQRANANAKRVFNSVLAEATSVAYEPTLPEFHLGPCLYCEKHHYDPTVDNFCGAEGPECNHYYMYSLDETNRENDAWVSDTVAENFMDAEDFVKGSSLSYRDSVKLLAILDDPTLIPDMPLVDGSAIDKVWPTVHEACASREDIPLGERNTELVACHPTKEGAFRYMPRITKVDFDPECKSVPTACFIGNDHLGSVDFPEGLEHIGTAAFKWCSTLTRVVIPESVKTLGEDCFAHCWNLQEVILPESLSEYPDSAFSGCPYVTVTWA